MNLVSPIPELNSDSRKDRRHIDARPLRTCGAMRWPEKNRNQRENLVNVAEPGPPVVLRHEVQLDEQEFRFRQRLRRAGEHRFFITLDVNFQKRYLRKIDN